MSHPIAYYDYYQELWDRYAPQYLKWCRDNNVQADLSDFQIYLEDNNLIAEDEVYAG